MKNQTWLARTAGVLMSLLLASAPAWAQSTATKGQTLRIDGKTLDGAVFDAGPLKGKVVMVFYWSAGCGVCLSHMPELRANLAGWRGKPFELVTVNVDADMANWRAYEQIVAKTQAPGLKPIWSGQASAQRLPITLILDTKGSVALRIEGRIATEAWDLVADLLP